MSLEENLWDELAVSTQEIKSSSQFFKNLSFAWHYLFGALLYAD